MDRMLIIHTQFNGEKDHVELGRMGRVKNAYRLTQLSDGESTLAGIYAPIDGELVKGTLEATCGEWHEGRRVVGLELKGPDGAVWGSYSYIEDGAA